MSDPSNNKERVASSRQSGHHSKDSKDQRRASISPSSLLFGSPPSSRGNGGKKTKQRAKSEATLPSFRQQPSQTSPSDSHAVSGQLDHPGFPKRPPPRPTSGSVSFPGMELPIQDEELVESLPPLDPNGGNSTDPYSDSPSHRHGKEFAKRALHALEIAKAKAPPPDPFMSGDLPASPFSFSGSSDYSSTSSSPFAPSFALSSRRNTNPPSFPNLSQSVPGQSAKVDPLAGRTYAFGPPTGRRWSTLSAPSRKPAPDDPSLTPTLDALPLSNPDFQDAFGEEFKLKRSRRKKLPDILDDN